MKTIDVVVYSPEHEAAVMAVARDPQYIYVPQEYPKAVNGELALDAAHEARLKGEPAPTAEKVPTIEPVAPIVEPAPKETE